MFFEKISMSLKCRSQHHNFVKIEPNSGAEIDISVTSTSFRHVSDEPFLTGFFGAALQHCPRGRLSAGRSGLILVWLVVQCVRSLDMQVWPLEWVCS